MHVFERHPELLKKLGKHRTGKVCLYLRRLADVDMNVLKKLVEASVRYSREKQRSPTTGASSKRRVAARSSR